jgi:hypothetical protein
LREYKEHEEKEAKDMSQYTAALVAGGKEGGEVRRDPRAHSWETIYNGNK